MPRLIRRTILVCLIVACFTLSSLLGFPASAYALQADAPFIQLQERNQDTWKAEDQIIDQKLAALRQRFNGKRPNIIYILADDVGWGELGGDLYPGLFAVTPIQNALREHMKLIQKFPHRQSEVTPKGAELTPDD